MNPVVWVVEENRQLRGLMSKLVRACGLRCHVAEHVEDALQLPEPPNVVVTDYWFGEGRLTGADLARRMHVPVIGMGRRADRHLFEPDVLFLPKPMGAAEFALTVREVCVSRRAA